MILLPGILTFLSNNSLEHEWIPWKFRQVADGFWSDMQNQRNFFENLAVELKLQNMEDWYKVTSQVYKEVRFADNSLRW
jgi:hypothetical protein